MLDRSIAYFRVWGQSPLIAKNIFQGHGVTAPIYSWHPFIVKGTGNDRNSRTNSGVSYTEWNEHFSQLIPHAGSYLTIVMDILLDHLKIVLIPSSPALAQWLCNDGQAA